MSTYTRAAAPLDVVIGRPWSLPLKWQNPDGTTIDTTGMGIDAQITWGGQASPLVPAVTARVDATGTSVLTLSSGSTATVPEGRLSTLRVTYTETGGDTHDIDIWINGIRP